MKNRIKNAEKLFKTGTTICTIERVMTDDGVFVVVRGRQGEIVSRRVENGRKFEVSITGKSSSNKVEAEIWLPKRGES